MPAIRNTSPRRKSKKQSGQNMRPDKGSARTISKLPVQAALQKGIELTSQDLISLQQSVGNQAVAGFIQTKLKVGPVSDRYEQEADKVADQVSRPPVQAHPQQIQRQPEDEELVQAKPLAAWISPIVQRQSMIEDEELLQGKRGGGDRVGFYANSEVERQIAQQSGRGRNIPDNIRQAFESRFGTDFSGVRLHTGSEANQLNQQLQARAFTHGNDVYFGAGQYQPGTQQGRHLIAHELTHVVQQTGRSQPTNQTLHTSQQDRRVVQNGADRGKAVVQREIQWQSNPLYEEPDPQTLARLRAKKDARMGKEARKITDDDDYGPSGAVGEGAGMVENLTGISGLFGTEGKGNTGFVDVGKNMESDFKGKVDSGLSGRSDLAGGLGGMVGSTVGMYSAIKDLRDPDTGKADKAAAGFELASSSAGAFANTQKAVAGGLDWAGNDDKSSFFPNNSSAVASSDVKHVGDWAGVASGGLSFGAESIKGGKQFAGWVKDIKGGRYSGKEKGGRGKWSLGRSVGRGVKGLTSWGKSGVVTSREGVKLAGQIQGGGDLAKSSLMGAAKGLTTATGALNVATGAMDMARGGYKIFKAGKRRSLLTEKLKQEKQKDGLKNVFDDPQMHKDMPDTDPRKVKAMEHLMEIQKKKQASGGINMALGSLGVLSGALALSGFGAIPGLAIGAATGGFQLGRWGFRKFKQAMRDKAAKREDEGKEKNWFLKKFNTAKSSDKKAAKNLETAKTLLDMEKTDPEVLRTAGITEKELNKEVKNEWGEKEPPSEEEKLKRIMKALKKR